MKIIKLIFWIIAFICAGFALQRAAFAQAGGSSGGNPPTGIRRGASQVLIDASGNTYFDLMTGKVIRVKNTCSGASVSASGEASLCYDNSTAAIKLSVNGGTYSALITAATAAAVVPPSSPVGATYITQTPNATLTNEQALSALSTGIVKNTTTTGVLSIAVAGTDYENPLTFSSPLSRSVNAVSCPTCVTGASGTNGQLQHNNAGAFGGFTLTGDCTLAVPNITCTKSSGVAFGTNAFTSTAFVPQTTTVNGKALSGNITLNLASADYANQGTTTTVLHGNAAGNPSFGAVSLVNDVTGTLGTGNGGTGQTAATDDTVAVYNGTGTDLKAVPNCTDTTGNHLNYTAASNSFTCGTSSAGGTSAGSDTQVQFNDAGAFGGDAGMTYSKTTDALTVNSSVTSQHFVGRGTTPTCTAGVNTIAGTGATCTPTGNDSFGQVTLTTGTGVSANGFFLTLTFNAAFATAPICIINGTNINAVGLATETVPTPATTTLKLSTVSALLSDNTTYIWVYHCGGR